MKIVFFITATFLSVPAFADYFSCHLKVGEEAVVSQVSDYKILESKVVTENWTCEGSSDDTGLVTVKLRNKGIYGEEKAQNRLFSTVEVRDVFLYDMPDFVASCTCGWE